MTIVEKLAKSVEYWESVKKNMIDLTEKPSLGREDVEKAGKIAEMIDSDVFPAMNSVRTVIESYAEMKVLVDKACQNDTTGIPYDIQQYTNNVSEILFIANGEISRFKLSFNNPFLLAIIEKYESVPIIQQMLNDIKLLAELTLNIVIKIKEYSEIKCVKKKHGGGG